MTRFAVPLQPGVGTEPSHLTCLLPSKSLPIHHDYLFNEAV